MIYLKAVWANFNDAISMILLYAAFLRIELRSYGNNKVLHLQLCTEVICYAILVQYSHEIQESNIREKKIPQTTGNSTWHLHY